MSYLISLLQKTSTRRGVITLFILQLIAGVGIASQVGAIAELTDGLGILDFEFGYTHEFVLNLFANYGAEGLSRYKWIAFFDLFNPLIYSTWLATIMYYFVQNTRLQWVVVLPFAAGLLDYLENAFILVMVSSYPDVAPGIVAIASTLSIIKRGASIIGALFLIIGITQWVIARRTK